MTPEEEEARSRIGLEIRGLHPAAYKTGEWAEIIGVQWVADRSRWCYQLIWPDGSTDLWATEDPAAEYQLRGERLAFGELAEDPKPQRDDSVLARARRAEVPGHSWQLQFGETRMGMPDYTKVRTVCSCGWHGTWKPDAEDARLQWNDHSALAG